jgi:hypothetical protein
MLTKEEYASYKAKYTKQAEDIRESVRVLMDMLENGRPPRHIVVPAKVQMRESV